MPTYVTLMRWTDQGIRTAKETVNRYREARSMAEQMGGKITANYWTQGTYDVVFVHEWPDEDSAMAFLLRVGMQGNLRTETLRAFGETDMERILQKLP
jgi:uncharacterized protein with GYD domain